MGSRGQEKNDESTVAAAAASASLCQGKQLLPRRVQEVAGRIEVEEEAEEEVEVEVIRYERLSKL